MAVSTITLYGGSVPDPFTQDATTFSTNAVAWTTYQANTLVSDINTSIGEFNIDFGLVNTAKDDAETAAVNSANSATESATSAQVSASSANYKGEWSAQTGAANKPYSVSHNGAFWQLANNLVDITLSEPSGSNSDWVFASGTRWQELTSSATVAANSMVTVYATSGAVDVTQPAFVKNDFLVVNNDPSSSQTVRILNPSNTVTGIKGSISAGDNIVIAPGSTVHLVARTTNILKVV